MPVLIRPRRSEDLDRLLTIWRTAVEESHHFLTPADVDWYETLVAQYLPQMADLRVAFLDGHHAAGFIAQDNGEIHMLFVDPANQGLGIGTALLSDVAQTHKTLRLDVNEQNPSARAFYSARGFVEVGRSELDGQGRPFPLLHLRRESTD